MATRARRKTTIAYSGDVDGEQVLSAADNVASPGTITFHDLGVGNNSIPVASYEGPAATAVTIVPNTDNTFALILKGNITDVGVRLHNTDPTTIALHSSVENIVLNAAVGSNITVRCFWS